MLGWPVVALRMMRTGVDDWHRDDMTDRPSMHAAPAPAPADAETADAAVGPCPDARGAEEIVRAEEIGRAEQADGTEKLGEADDDEKKPFGEQEATRFASDVEYRGRAGGHDYLVRVRHRLLDTSFTVVIDGIEHDPAAEEKASKKAKESKKAAERPADETDSDGLRFRLDESFTVVRCTVRRRVEDDGDVDDEVGDPGKGEPGAEDGDGGGPDHTDAEVISVHTAGLGGAGEVDVRHDLEKTLLVPAEDSPSAVRDEKRIAHPAKYAMLSALAKAAGFLIPLLGIGGLFGGLLDPVKEWVEARVRPVVDAISAVTEPVRTWFGELVRPVVEFLDGLLAPVRSVIAAVLRPIGDAWNWLTELLFGWIPDVSLPFSVPEWVVDAALPVIVVLIAFLVTFGSLRHRREKLDATRTATQAHDGHDGATGRNGRDSASAADAGAEGDEDEMDVPVRGEESATEDATSAQWNQTDRGVPTSPDRSSTEPVRPQR